MTDFNDEEDFGKGVSGASATVPVRAGELKIGSYVVIAGRPCKVAQRNVKNSPFLLTNSFFGVRGAHTDRQLFQR
jgi:hypothetical protein